MRNITVVICFHFTIFVVLITTLQLSIRSLLCCDLLSFYYLCRTDNNPHLGILHPDVVVICFHFTIFVVLITTLSKQPSTPKSCDLLSFYYLCRTDNNGSPWSAITCSVVICFHFTIFVVLITTNALYKDIENELWFAFILLSLSYW